MLLGAGGGFCKRLLSQEYSEVMNQPQRIRGGGQLASQGAGRGLLASPDSPPPARLSPALSAALSPGARPPLAGHYGPAINNPAWVRAQVTLWKYLPQSLLRPASSLGTRGRGGERLRSAVDLKADGPGLPSPLSSLWHPQALSACLRRGIPFSAGGSELSAFPPVKWM